MRTNQEIFEATQGTVETLVEYHVTHDSNPDGGRISNFEAVEAAMEDVRAFNVSEEIIVMHTMRLHDLLGF